MKLIVNPHKIELIKEEAVNEKEINISKCTFEFSEEYGDNLVKEAYFTLEGKTYKQIIVNNECSYPPEVLAKEGTVELGVVAYEVQDETYIERFNPSPVYFQTWIGSLKANAENSKPITPSEMEQFEQALEEGLAEVANVDIDANKVEHTATVIITDRNGVTKSVEIYDGEQGPQGIPGKDGKDGVDGKNGQDGKDGKDGKDGQDGITPNIQIGTTITLPAGSNASVTQRGTQTNPIFDFGIPKGADGTAGTLDYTDLTNKPSINNVTLSGNKTSSDLSLQDALVSGTNIKTINNTSLLGSGNIEVAPSIDIDGSTITKNADDELQTVGIKDNNSGNTDKIWTGTLAQYNALISGGTIDNNTFYYITDDDATSTLRQKVEVITSSTSTYTIANLTSNKSYKLGEITSLTITACETFDEESVIYFDSGSTATSISIPSDITNLGDAPTMTTASDINTGTCEASKSYIISILNKIAVWKAY